MIVKVVSWGPYINPLTGRQQKTEIFNRQLRIPPTVIELDEVTMAQENSGCKIISDDDEFQAVIIEEGDGNVDQEMTPEVLNAFDTLKSTAEAYNVTIECEFKEIDTGIQARSVLFQCDIKAGLMKGSGQSTCKEIAKEIAADKLLKQLNENDSIPAWKTLSSTLDEINDAVHLLDLYCKSRHWNTPTYNYMGLKIGNEKKEHVYLCIVNSLYKEGRSRSKGHAKRLAAFEMLNFFIENKKSVATETCPPSNYASLDPVTISCIRNNPEHLEQIKPTIKPFEICSQKPNGPGEPSELKTRYFYNTEKKGHGTLRHMVEIISTFQGISEDSIDEARAMSVSNAKNFIDIVPKYFTQNSTPAVPLTESNANQ